MAHVITDYLAGMVERAADILAYGIEHTPEDKRDWRPQVTDASETRSILDFTDECIKVCRRWGALIVGAQAPAGYENSAPRKFSTSEEAIEMLRAAATEFATSVRNVDDAELTDVIQLSWGRMAKWGMIEIALSNLHYHCGQMAFIQTLYGDTEFYVPPGGFSIQPNQPSA